MIMLTPSSPTDQINFSMLQIKMKVSNHDQMMFNECINLLKSQSSIYSDIKVISNAGLTTFTSKVLIFLTNPFLQEELRDSDLIIINEEPCEPAICRDVQDDVQPKQFATEAFIEQTKENDIDYLSDNNQNEESSKEQHLCQLCGGIFPSMKLLQKHTGGLSNNSANTRCRICSKQFCSSEKLTQHLWVHTDFKYECSICKVSIKHLRNYQRHMKSHDEHRSNIIINCDFCSVSFKSRSNFKRHLKNIHKI